MRKMSYSRKIVREKLINMDNWPKYAYVEGVLRYNS
jgi:hypothetical protein